MADFNPPIASVGGVTRAPTVLEKANGLQCGPADLKLFNFLFQKIQAELKAIQDAGGIAGDDADDTTVLQAILELISSATGGGDPSNYIQFPLAQANLPFFPEVKTNNGVIPVIDLGTGNIRIPASATILHRGIRTYTTVQTDLPTVLSKMYHLRWSPTGGFVLKDLADLGYNPTIAAEGNAAFDSTYDDMLVARIQTNSSNVPTITNLTNKDRYSTVVGRSSFVDVGAAGAQQTDTYTLNLARAPKIALSKSSENVTGSANDGGETAIFPSVPTRYGFTVQNYTIAPSTGRAYATVYDYTVWL